MFQSVTSLHILTQSPKTLMIDDKLKLQILNLKYHLFFNLKTSLQKFFQYDDLSCFDPHIGENCCQARACQILSLIDHLSQNKHNNIYINNRIEVVQKSLTKIKNLMSTLKERPNIKRYQSKLLKIKQPYQTLESFLIANECVIDLYQYELFLLHVFILSQNKKTNDRGEICIDFTGIQDNLNITKSIAKQLVHKYQVSVSKYTCMFVKQLACQSPKLKHLHSILDKFEHIDSDGRHMLPLFLTTEILLDNLLRTNKTVILLVERKIETANFDSIVMCFRPNHQKDEFVYCGSDVDTIIDEETNPCFFIFGTVSYNPHEKIESPANYIIRFNQFGLVNIVMADTAIHPQFSGNVPPIYKTNPYATLRDDENLSKNVASILHRFNERLAVAIKYGFGKNSRYLLFIKHIQGDYAKNRL